MTPRLSSWQIWLLVISGGSLWVSGAVWLLLHHFFRKYGQYGALVHPGEPVMMQIHGAVMYVMLLGVGSLLAVHVVKGWGFRHQRVIGLLMSAVIAVLIVTGYCLHYAIEEEIRETASLIHWVIGLGLPVIFAYHWINGRAGRQKI